jgi:hypothetical protein
MGRITFYISRRGGREVNVYDLRRVAPIINLSIVLIGLSCLILVIVNQAHAKKILIKDVPYVHQRWQLD